MRGTYSSDRPYPVNSSPSQNFFEDFKKFFKNLLTKAICYVILYSQGARGTNLLVILSQ